MDKKLTQLASLIDLDALPGEVRWRVEAALESANQSYCLDRQMAAACNSASDRELIAFAEREYPDALIGLSTWYKTIDICQETIFNRIAHNGTRRPVFMRGSREVRIRRHCLTCGGGGANGWAARVFWRAVRMAKITALDRVEFEDATRGIRDKLHKRYYLTTPFERNIGWDVWGGPNVIGGNVSFLDESQVSHIKKLRNIASRFDDLDKRRNAVKTLLMERLAQ